MNDYNSIPEDYCNLYFDKAIDKWDEAIPLGNGLCGCLVWGDGFPLRFSLDRGDLWDTRPAPEIMALDFKYEKMIELVKHKDQDGIREKFDRPYYRTTPTKVSAGKIFMSYGKKAEDVQSILDIKNASAEITLRYGEKYSCIRTFMHANEKTGHIHISGDLPLPEIEIAAPEFGILSSDDEENDDFERKVSNGSLKQLKYPPVEHGCENELRWFVQKTPEGLEYGIVIGQRLKHKDMEIAYYIGANICGCGDWLESTKKQVEKALDIGFEGCFKEHASWWMDFWAKSSLKLPDKDFEKQWYLTNYLFGSCSRKGSPPMPLQGVWTADDGELPPWKGDYHHDLNTQMSYCHYLKANHIEEGESFIDFLWKLVPRARSFAESFFCAPGLCLPTVMDINGGPLGGWAMYSYTLTGQAWICQSFANHWEYTGDMDFLKHKAYPYLKESALCILKWLKPDSNGKLRLPLSSSPEIHNDELEAWVTPNSNYDLSLIIFLFHKLAEMSKILQNKDLKNWERILKALPELAINENNVLMISPEESLKESHRHLAHAMAIYPLKILDYDRDIRSREIIDATVLNLELLGTGLWTGYTFPWMAQLYAVQGNGEGAAYQLKIFWENFCSPNGFHLNGDYMKRGLSSFHYRPFTLEGNMAAADAVQEMLLKTDGELISVFPAVPERWRKKGVSFGNFRGRNGVLISSEIKDKKLVFINLKATRKSEYAIVNSFESNMLVIMKNGENTTVNCPINSHIKVHLKENEECTITEWDFIL